MNGTPRRAILGQRVEPVEDPEELLWRVAAFLDNPQPAHARQNFRARILKALDGGDWRAELTDEDVDRYA